MKLHVNSMTRRVAAVATLLGVGFGSLLGTTGLFVGSAAAVPGAVAACDMCDGWTEATGTHAHQLGSGGDPSCCNSEKVGDPGECGHGTYFGLWCSEAHDFCLSGCNETVAKVDPEVFDRAFRAAEMQDWVSLFAMVQEHPATVRVFEERSAVELTCASGSLAALIPVPAEVMESVND